MKVERQLLRVLRSGQALTREDLIKRLQTDGEGFQEALYHLEKLGFRAEITPHRGYRLVEMPDILYPDDIAALLPEDIIVGRDIQVFTETASTNDIADKLGRSEVPEGAVIFAEQQTKGRGRLGRKWFSPPGRGLWFSVLLRPDLRPQAATQLTVAAGVSVLRALERHASVQCDIKWPNDVLIRGKKIAGVLTEMSAELDRIRYMIVGIGVDVNLAANELPAELESIATSLSIETGAKHRRADLAAAILREFDADYRRIRSGQFKDVAEEWESRCSTLGRRINIKMGERIVHGCAESLDEDGALLLRTDHGHLERIVGGDVTIAK